MQRTQDQGKFTKIYIVLNSCHLTRNRGMQCDELLPRCSRCKKKNLACQYPKRQGIAAAPDDYGYGMDPIDPLLLQQLHVSRQEYGVSSPDESSGFSLSGFTASSFGQSTKWPDLPLSSGVVQTLAPAEFELLKHYLEHTSKDLTVDETDQYTLQIGIPHLACQSKPLMKSILALAAVCKCCDIINQPAQLSHQDRAQVIELLALADHYHGESLRETRAILPEAKHYDHVLANAAMMGMYGSGSHCTRIWLAKTAPIFGDKLAIRDYMPRHSQWISFFRAAHLAYAGIVNNTLRTDDMAYLGPPRLSALDPVIASTSSPLIQFEYKVTPRFEQQPRKSPTNHPLSPILAATVGSALAKLRETAMDILTIVQASNTTEFGYMSGYDDPNSPMQTGSQSSTGTSSPALNAELQACFTALAIFSNIISETFPATDNENGDRSQSGLGSPGHGRGNHTRQSSHLAFDVDIDPSTGSLCEVSPWLRKYTANITSMVPSRLPRRIIMSFIHKVPTRYLCLVEDMLSLIRIQTEAAESVPPSAGLSPAGGASNILDEDIMAWGGPTIHVTTSSPSSSSLPSSHNTPGMMPPPPTPTAPPVGEPSIAQQLAMEIFTHWLVLVILLDDVWWIGGLGSWELSRIMTFRRNRRKQHIQAQGGWPQATPEISLGNMLGLEYKCKQCRRSRWGSGR